MEKPTARKNTLLTPQTAHAALGTLEIGQASTFSANYGGGAPLPVLAFHGTGPLHRFQARRCDWNYALVLAEKAPRIVRSDRRESTGEKEWRDILIDEGQGTFIHLDDGFLAAYAPTLAAAKSAALGFRDRFAAAGPAPATYHLITNHHDNIDTEPVVLSEDRIPTGPDLDLLYGHGFAGWVDSFAATLSSKKSGLSVFEGPPGTGKTSFLRHLIHRLSESHRFYFIPPANAGILSNPEFIGFWSQQHACNPDTRFVCVLEDAEGALMVRDNDNRRQAGAILNITDGLLADFLRLHIVCSINCHSSQIDPAFMRPGRLVAHRIFPRLGAAEARRIAAKFGRQLPLRQDYSLAEIFNADERQEPEKPRIGFAA
jgi:hypothetical protein